MIFDANKITCKKCGSSDIRALKMVSKVMLIKEWLLSEGRLLIHNYDIDDVCEVSEEDPMFWCSDCYELDGEIQEFYFDEMSEYLNIPEEEE